MTALETLLVTANTLESIEATLAGPGEEELRSAIEIARKVVVDMLDEEVVCPGTHQGLAD